MMAASFVAALQSHSVGDRHQISNPPVSRVVSHPGQHFLVRAHRVLSVAYDTRIFQPTPIPQNRLARTGRQIFFQNRQDGHL